MSKTSLGGGGPHDRFRLLWLQTTITRYFFICRTITITLKMPKRCRKKWRGGLKETIKLFIIRPPQLQFFTDGIKITATKTKYYQVEN